MTESLAGYDGLVGTQPCAPSWARPASRRKIASRRNTAINGREQGEFSTIRSLAQRRFRREEDRPKNLRLLAPQCQRYDGRRCRPVAHLSGFPLGVAAEIAEMPRPMPSRLHTKPTIGVAATNDVSGSTGSVTIFSVALRWSPRRAEQQIRWVTGPSPGCSFIGVDPTGKYRHEDNNGCHAT